MYRSIIIGAIAAFLLVLVVCVVLPMYVAFPIKLSDRGKRDVCRQRIHGLLEVTNLVDTVQEAADILREFEDTWNHKFNVIVADEFSRKSFGGASVGNLIMWSSGPNGINENGKGDDLVAGSDPEFRARPKINAESSSGR
jgi:hypothetical protein